MRVFKNANNARFFEIFAVFFFFDKHAYFENLLLLGKTQRFMPSFLFKSGSCSLIRKNDSAIILLLFSGSLWIMLNEKESKSCPLSTQCSLMADLELGFL